MATQTTNFDLTKPAQGQAPWDVDINANLDKIDTALKSENQVIVDSSQGTAAGPVKFDTLANAVTYVNTQSPAHDDNWEILMKSPVDVGGVTLGANMRLTGTSFKNVITGSITLAGPAINFSTVFPQDAPTMTGIYLEGDLLTSGGSFSGIVKHCFLFGAVNQSVAASFFLFNENVLLFNNITLNAGFNDYNNQYIAIASLTLNADVNLFGSKVDFKDVFSDSASTVNLFGCQQAAIKTKIDAANDVIIESLGTSFSNISIDGTAGAMTLKSGWADSFGLSAAMTSQVNFLDFGAGSISRNSSISIIRVNKSSPIAPGEKILSTGFTSYGSTNTSVVRFASNVNTQNLSALTFSDSAANGTVFFVQETGKYSIRLNCTAPTAGDKMAVVIDTGGAITAGPDTYTFRNILGDKEISTNGQNMTVTYAGWLQGLQLIFVITSGFTPTAIELDFTRLD